jgi:branched-chain amino acid transport system permease protein
MIDIRNDQDGLPWGDAFFGSVRALILAGVIVGMRTTSDESGILRIDYRPWDVVTIVATVFFVRLLLPMARGRQSVLIGTAGIVAVFASIGYSRQLGEIQFATFLVAGLAMAVVGLATQARKNERMRALLVPRGQPATAEDIARRTTRHRSIALMGLAAAIAFPFLPFADRYWLDLAILILTYLVLGWGLNIVVGLAGLLDLGFVAFYAVGAYAYALLAIHFDISFWVALPLAAVLAAFAGFLLGFPVLRLRGDYFAIVTLGFGEIIRIILLNWSEMSGGPDGLTGVPRPSFFGIAEFERQPQDGQAAFHQLFGLEFSTMHRIVFLYFIVLALAVLASYIATTLRKMPIGRAWEALREDEIACQAMGVSRASIKLWAFMISAAFGGMAGAFFATRQGYVSPESFTFIESAIVLAIVVLGGMGSQLGVFLATLLIIGLPEAFREVEQYRMLAFGAAMVLVMIWRPGGLLANREPSVRYAQVRDRIRKRLAAQEAA